jgi:hypothetical protein
MAVLLLALALVATVAVLFIVYLEANAALHVKDPLRLRPRASSPYRGDVVVGEVEELDVAIPDPVLRAVRLAFVVPSLALALAIACFWHETHVAGAMFLIEALTLLMIVIPTATTMLRREENASAVARAAGPTTTVLFAAMHVIGTIVVAVTAEWFETVLIGISFYVGLTLFLLQLATTPFFKRASIALR